MDVFQVGQAFGPYVAVVAGGIANLLWGKAALDATKREVDATKREVEVKDSEIGLLQRQSAPEMHGVIAHFRGLIGELEEHVAKQEDERREQQRVIDETLAALRRSAAQDAKIGEKYAVLEEKLGTLTVLVKELVIEGDLPGTAD